jgi:L-alanine-DL-glutamate epimerase-like enolase superfamily enzyme
MKVGREPARDFERVSAARHAIGNEPALFVDANGGYMPKQAVKMAETFGDLDVSWFEEPVSSDDLSGLRLVRKRCPSPMQVAAGEYGFDSYYFRRMLGSGAVDVLQIDGTRCGGITGFIKAAQLADAFQIPVSAHTAPAFHLAICCSVPRLLHLEYFYDHVRIESLLFEGIPDPVKGALEPDLSRPGNGLEVKRKDISRFAA